LSTPPDSVNRRRVAVVARIETDDLIAGAHQRGDGGEQRFGGAGGDGHFAAGVRLPAIQLGGFVGDGFAQRRHAGHRRILVGALGDVPGQAFFQVVRPVEIREALRQVDRLMLLRQRAHLGEDGGAQGRQFTFGNQCGSAHSR
jgi:hypothetical protein